MAEIKKYLDTAALGTLVEQIKAEDAKVLTAAKKYTDDAGSSYDVAGAAATAEQNAKAYTDQLANGAVKTNTDAIAKLNGDATTEGSVAKAIADAKADLQASIDATDAIADKNAEDIAAISNAETGILAQAKSYTDTEVGKVQGEVDALETYVGAIPEGSTATNVIAYVQEKTAGIATESAITELGNRIGTVEGKVATIEGDYLKDADKTELEGKIATVQSAVDTEKSRAEGIEAGLRTDVDAIKGDYLKAADKTELQGNIDTVNAAVERLTNGVSADEVDGVNDLIQYVKDHGSEVTGMQEDISENAAAIEGVAGRVTTAEGKITTLEGAVATKAEKTYVDEAIETLEGADAGQVERIAALEAKFGGTEGSVEDMIADAKAEAIAAAGTAADTKDATVLENAKKYTDEEVDKVEATISTLQTAVDGKASASDVSTLQTKVGTLETDMAQAKTDIDAVEALAAANKAAHEANATALKLKASQEDLDNAVARIAANETAIGTLNTTIEGKASSTDLDNAVARISANETAIAANTSAINSFTAITSGEVNALFA